MDLRKSIHKVELLFIVLFFILINSLYWAFFLSNELVLLSLIFTFTLIAYLIVYLTKSGTRTNGLRSALLHFLFAIAATITFLTIISDGIISPAVMLQYFNETATLGAFFTLFTPVFLFSFLGVYFAKRKQRKTAFVLLFVVLTLLITYYSSGFIVKSLGPDDEEFLTLWAVKLTLSGHNPYGVSLAGMLYNNSRTFPPAITTNNKILGTMDYPALFFLSFVPFYFASAPTLQNLGNIDMKLQTVAFLFMLLLSIGLLLGKKKLLRPDMALLVIFVVEILDISSIQTFLMLVLLVVAYAKINSKYAFLALGLALSIQQELWLPVLLLFTYMLSNQGVKKGLYNIIGAIVVFIALNSYFIFTGPAVFFSSILKTINGLLMPRGPTQISFFFIKNYPLLLSTYSVIFALLSLLMVVLLLYSNNKKLIPVFSIIPFTLLPTSLTTYYSLFFLFLFFVLALDEKDKKNMGRASKYLHRNRILFVLVVILAFAAIAYEIYVSHASYTKEFNIALENQSIRFDASTNATLYNGKLYYSNLTNSTIYVISVIYGNLTFAQLGLINYSIINPVPMPSCNNYTCRINTNKIILPSNRTVYDLNASIPWTNSTKTAKYLTIILYNGEYYYVGNGVG